MLPRKIPKPAKRASRWRSQSHCNFVRSHACCACQAESAIEVAHVRIGSGAGMGQKPDDFHTISLCRDCHQSQHSLGEKSFETLNGIDMRALADEFAKASPKAREINAEKAGR